MGRLFLTFFKICGIIYIEEYRLVVRHVAKAIVHCRACGEAFDRNELVEGIDWVKPANRIYYHKHCYEEYQRSKNDVHSKMTDEQWFDALWEFLTKKLKGNFDFRKVKSQWKNFTAKKMTAKGIFFASKYFYEIKKGDLSKSENGIGIIPHIYDDSCLYWHERERKDAGICAAIEQQLLKAANQEKVVVNKRRAKKKTINAAEQLAAIMGMEEEEE